MQHVNNVHILTVRCLPATNHIPTRIKITSERFRNSKNIGQSKIISGNHNFNSHRDAACYFLQNLGFNIIGKAEGVNVDYIISDTFDQLDTIILKGEKGNK